MMKRLLSAILCVLLIISLSGCKNEPAEYDSSAASSITETVETTSVVVTSGEQEDEKSDDITIEETESAIAEESNSTSETESTTAEKETTEKAQPPTQKVEETKPQPKPTETQTEQKPKEESVKETTATTEPAVTETPYVRPSAAEVEQAVVKYVNQYRAAQGDTQTTVLTGLTNVARYRARQLITNFAHADIREVCAELKYGKYVDLTEYGHPETDNYYEGYNREAIAKGGWGGTADEIAERIAMGFKNSTNHWRYVGDSKYGYMAVGAIYNEADNQWYICICMSKENYGG